MPWVAPSSEGQLSDERVVACPAGEYGGERFGLLQVGEVAAALEDVQLGLRDAACDPAAVDWWALWVVRFRPGPGWGT
jgi:hypothetical protein